MDIFKLISRYVEFCEKNPETVNNTASALYLYLLNLNNKLSWPDKFGLPRDHVMMVLGTSSHKTFSRAVDYLVQNGFIKQLSKSQNQYQSNVFALVKNTTARLKQVPQQVPDQVPQLDSSESCIDIPLKTSKDNINVRVENFVNYINKTFGKKYRVTEKVKGKFKARVEIDKYESQVLQDVIISLKQSTYHIDTNFRYCTPEFCLRVDKIEMYKSGAIIQNNHKNDSDPQPPKADYSEQAEYYRVQQSLGKVTTTGS